MVAFSPLSALVGGAMIGAAAGFMLLALGRVAGVSGLLARAAGLSEGAPRGLAIAFVMGLPLGALAVKLIYGVPAPHVAPLALIIPAGFLVGFGTRLGSGCTSGHGICGMARLSRRSIVATATFMIAGFATVAVMNHFGGRW
jgi:uncharacterized protein